MIPETPFASIACSARNLGDDIQVLAGLQYLPPDPLFVDRDRLSRFRGPPSRIILNGWFTHDPKGWIPAPALDPLVTSIHFADDDFYGPPSIAWLRDQASRRPIGARDIGTCERLQRFGIPAFHSGCLTLTLAAVDPVDRGDEICVVDLPQEAVALVRSRGAKVATPTHRLSRPQRFVMSRERRLRTAAALLARYRRSRAVVTRRLHAALPAVALGTSVLFVTDDPGKRRFSGLIDHLHAVSLDRFLAGRFDFDFADPPPNPNSWQRLAADLDRSVAAFTGRPRQPYDKALAAVLARMS